MTIKETNGGHVIIDSIRYPRDIKNLNKIFVKQMENIVKV